MSRFQRALRIVGRLFAFDTLSFANFFSPDREYEVSNRVLYQLLCINFEIRACKRIIFFRISAINTHILNITNCEETHITCEEMKKMKILKEGSYKNLKPSSKSLEIAARSITSCTVVQNTCILNHSNSLYCSFCR